MQLCVVMELKKKFFDVVRTNIGSCNITVSFHGNTIDPLIANLGLRLLLRVLPHKKIFCKRKMIFVHDSAVYIDVSQTQFCEVLHIESEAIQYVV